MRWEKIASRRTFLLFVCLAGCGGETNSGINCRFALSQSFEQRCADTQCTCRLGVSIQNIGTLTVSGDLHYDAFDAERRKVAQADFQVIHLEPGASRDLQNDLLDVDSNKPLKDCSGVATVESTTVPGCSQ